MSLSSSEGAGTGRTHTEAETPPLPLYAVGTEGVLQHFRVVEFLGGERGDMPSQGRFSFDSDRREIAHLEDQMMSSFGFGVIRNALALAAAAKQGASCIIDIGAKMLHDEHAHALAVKAAEGALANVTTLSFNANPYVRDRGPARHTRRLRPHTPDTRRYAHRLERSVCCSVHARRYMTTLPSLTSMPRLRSLSLINCSSLTAIGSLEGLPSLETLKLEGCTSLAALPALRPGARWDDDDAAVNFSAPEHLRANQAAG